MPNNSPAKEPIACRVCGGKAAWIFSKLILGKHDVHYLKCSTCGHAQTETPYWLKEAYAEKNSMLDVGMAGRSVWTAELAAALAYRMAVRPGEGCGGWGGGWGLWGRVCGGQGVV